MPILVNTSARSSSKLIDVLAREARKDATGHRTLYVLSCYFDDAALIKLVHRISRATRASGATLIGCEIALDIGDWTRQRADPRALAKRISDGTKLREDTITFHPICESGKLVHTKAYALIGPVLKASRERRGFVAITSGNLTQRGLGLCQGSNVELVHVSRDAQALDTFQSEFTWLTKSHPLSGARRREHDDFLLALRLLGVGCLFHKWEGNLSSEVAFRITLTNKGKEAAKADEVLLRGYEASGDTRSRDPIGLAQIFKHTAKPLPRHFWKAYSVDTALGKWVPREIAMMIDSVLSQEAAPYCTAIRSKTKPSLLDKTEAALRTEVTTFRQHGWINQEQDAVKKWRDRVEAFRDQDALIRARVFNYERVPDEVFESAGKPLVLRTFRGMHDRIGLKRKRLDGLRRIMLHAIEDGDENYDRDLNVLAEHARRDLEKHTGIRP